jgi:uncharacterized protein YgiM (DUF1202 family)
MARSVLLALLPILAAAGIVMTGHSVPPNGPFAPKPIEAVFRVKTDAPSTQVRSGPRPEDRTIGTIRGGTAVYDLRDEQNGWRHIAGTTWEGWVARTQLDGPTPPASGTQEADLQPA